MHFVIAALGLIAGVYFLVIRARNAAEMGHELLEIADDVRAAARRFGFRRKGAQHSMDAVEDPNIASAALATAYMELHGLPTSETRMALSNALQVVLDISQKDAQELMVLGRWLMNECGGAQPAVIRSAKKLYALGARDVTPVLEIAKSVSADPLSEQQREALKDIQRAFHIRGNQTA